MKVLILALVSAFVLTGCKGSKKSSARANNARQKAQQQVVNPAVDTGSKALPNVQSPITAPAVSPAAAPAVSPVPEVLPAITSADLDDSRPAKAPPVPTFQPPASVPKITDPKVAEKKADAPIAKVEEKKADDKKAEYEKLSELSFEETFDLAGVLSFYFGQERAARAATALIPPSIKNEDITSEYSGSHDKFSIKIKNKDEIIAEFKDAAMALNKPSSQQVGSYTLVGVCVRSKCEILFVTIVKEEGQKVVEKFPYILKMVDGKYVRVRGLNDKDFKEQLEKMPKPVDPAKVAIQMRAKLKFNENYKKSEEKILTTIRSQMKKFDTAYTDRLTQNAKSGTCNPLITAKPDEGYTYYLKCEFTDQKKPIAFVAALKNSMTKASDASGLILTGMAIIPNEFYMTIMEANLYESPVKGIKTAMSSQLCEVLTEEKTVYSYCAPILASSVLGVKAIEGKMEGQVYVDDIIIEDKEGQQKKQAQIMTREEIAAAKK